MSAQFKLFEGPDVQILLDRIRAEIGPSAKIDGAEKIRVGGLLGFFAKEHFRVRVEIPEPPTSPTDVVVDTAPGRLSRRARRRQAAQMTAAVGSPVVEMRKDRLPQTPPTQVQLPTAVESEAIVDAVPTRESDVFSVMAEATDDVIDVSSLPPTTAASVSPPLQPPSVAQPVVAAEPVVAEHPSVANESLAGSFDAVLTRVATSLEVPTNGHGPPSGNSAGHRTGYPAEPEMSTEDHLSAAPPDIASKAAQFLAENSPVLPDSGVLFEPTAPSDAVAATAARLDEDRFTPEDPVTEALRGAGLHDELVLMVSAARHQSSLEAALVQAFASVPAAPALPRSPGSLLVVVGPGGPARRLAAALAGEMGVDPAGIPLASLDAGAYSFVTGSLLVRSADEGAERAPGWRRSNPAVVVVDACVTGPHRSWASHVIGALRPTAVWGVVDATSKTEDIGAWAQALGGIDALALENVDATVSPASALSAGLPVARLDGQPATATRWAAALIDQMGPSSNWVESDAR